MSQANPMRHLKLSCGPPVVLETQAPWAGVLETHPFWLMKILATSSTKLHEPHQANNPSE